MYILDVINWWCRSAKKNFDIQYILKQVTFTNFIKISLLLISNILYQMKHTLKENKIFIKDLEFPPTTQKFLTFNILLHI